MLLGHFCSIITSLHQSQDGKYIITTDRDNKVRVSNMPLAPLQVGKAPLHELACVQLSFCRLQQYQAAKI